VIGRTILHYRIVRQLGRGGMGVVFAAEDLKLGRTVALKFLAPERVGSAESLARLRREARAASSLNHENICTIFAVEDAGTEPFIVMELLEGHSLESLLHTPLSPERVLDIGTQAADALAAAHSRNILHRDIKPANLFLTQRGRLKVLDFGVAKLATPNAMSATAATDDYAPQLTAAGAAVGTAAYMSPEQARGEELDARCDLFSLGCVLYQLATGRHPFQAPTQAAMFHAILDPAAPAAPSHFQSALPPHLDEIILKILEKDRELRTQSAAELRADLKRIQRELSGGSTAAATAAASGAARSGQILHGSGRLTVALTLAALVLLAAAIWLAPWRNKSHATTAQSPPPPQVLTRVTGRPSPVPEANESLQRAVNVMETDLPRARKLLERTLQLDPKFGEVRCWHAFSGLLMLVTGYTSDYQELYRAEEELRPALRDDPNSPHCHAVLSHVYYYQGRFELMRKEAEAAARLDPQDSDANIVLANYSIMRGDYAETQRLCRKLTNSNPLFFPPRMAWADAARQLGDVAGATAELNKVLDTDPHNIFALQLLVLIQLGQGDAAAARKTLAAVAPQDRDNYNVRFAWADVYAFEHDRARALKEMTPQTVSVIRLDPALVIFLAEFYALLGEKEQALDWLERAIRGGDERAEFFAADPLLASLRDDPRFKTLLISLKNAIADRRQTANSVR
jgi:Tfp pilus assembly protein PilF